MIQGNGKTENLNDLRVITAGELFQQSNMTSLEGLKKNEKLYAMCIKLQVKYIK